MPRDDWSSRGEVMRGDGMRCDVIDGGGNQ